MGSYLRIATIFAVLASLLGSFTYADPSNIEAFQQRAASLENTTVPLPCSRPSSIKGWFEFVVLKKDSAGKAFDQTEACQLIEGYANHMYGSLAKFWPLNHNLGLELSVQKYRSSYNASFESNLANPYFQPRLGLIYIAGLPKAPQRYIWSHEYGHAVLDEYVRNILNQRYDFDRIIRRASITWDRGGSDLELEISQLKKSREEIRKQSFDLHESQNDRILAHNQALHDLSDLSNKQRERSDLFHKMKNLRVDIRNSWMSIRNSGANLAEYPEGQDLLGEQDDLTKGLTSFLKPNPAKINGYLAAITSAKSKIARLMIRARSYPMDLEAKIQRTKVQAETIETEAQKLREEEEKFNGQLQSIDGQIGRLTVQDGIDRHLRLKREGVNHLPGVSIYSYYHEFFADLFAAIFHNDPNAIGDSFVSIMGQELSDYADARRFSPLHPEKFDFSTWIPEKDPAHLFFTPVRAALGAEAINRVNREFKGRLFLTKVLDFIASQIVNYTIDVNNDLLLPYEPFVQRFSNLQAREEILSALDQAIRDSSLSSAFFEMRDLKNWCAVDFNSCRKLIVSELKAGHEGVFSTSIKIHEANSNLHEGLVEILKTL